MDKSAVYEELKKNPKNVGGWAKPYQVRQLLKIIDKYNLLKEGNNV
jgi:hypothetical protein